MKITLFEVKKCWQKKLQRQKQSCETSAGVILLNRSVKGLFSRLKKQEVNCITRCKKDANLSSKITKYQREQSGKYETKYHQEPYGDCTDLEMVYCVYVHGIGVHMVHRTANNNSPGIEIEDPVRKNKRSTEQWDCNLK